MLLQGGLACLVQALGVGSSAVFFVAGLPILIALVIDAAVSNKNQEVSLLSYAVGELMPLTIGATLSYAMLDVFVPLVRV